MYCTVYIQSLAKELLGLGGGGGGRRKVVPHF